ncbi:hypothetical protein RDWZM_005230 [Blomia tropicalis]|uniref:Enolase-phosphatase E1 n=1 Tax=Blomia tropicalis TaxID=40697 RepID=A0A9Q0M6A4_BLOTA|nr:Enolase-phosphatase E1 [Blomia tropicalis]KAJ6219418.1 hypothetical protein RDWZM_005230 [Blomia tropicalis]
MVQVKIQKPKLVLFDVSGTAARESFVEKILLPYFKIAARIYFDNNWGTAQCDEDMKALARAAAAQAEAPKIDLSMPKPQVIDALQTYIDWAQEKLQDNTRAFSTYRFHVWFDGYDRGKLTTPVYSDVAVTIQKWRCDLNVRLYILSNGWAEATKKFMSKTSHGDLNLLIEGHFDTSSGPLTEPSTFKKVVEQIGANTSDVLFLTKSPEEGKAAKDAGLNVILVLTHRGSVDQALQMCKDIPIARTFTEIEFI